MWRPRHTRPGRAALVPVVLVLALGSASACSDDTSGPEAGVTVDDLTVDEARDEIGLDESDWQRFEEYLGEVVTVSGDLALDIAPRAFTLGGPAGTESLLVLAPEDLELPDVEPLEGDPAEGPTVQVTGEVRSFVFDDLDDVDAEALREVGEAQLLAFDGKPYIDATEVRVLP